jgi:hypothetical protein
MNCQPRASQQAERCYQKSLNEYPEDLQLLLSELIELPKVEEMVRH